MSYLVLARKWRPQFFDEVVGQQHVAQTLKNSIEQDRVAHAYLFCGARGVGKTSTARILAKALNCEEGPTSKPCLECDSCKEIDEGQSVDVFEIDGASNRGINEIRELREGVRYAPSRDRFKIYIIDEVHMLTTEAFNALLKTLEEPPDHAYFIFATTEPQKIPITILSRCQRFDFKRIGQEDIVEHLAGICEKEGLEVEREALQLIARQADGAMRDALSLLDQVIGFAGDEIDEEVVASILGVANREHLFEISASILERDAQEALRALDVVDRYGYDLQQFASELVTHLRDLTVAAAVEEPAKVTDLTASELDEANDQLEAMQVDGERRRQLLHRYFSVMAEGARKMTRSPYPKLIFEMTLVRLTDLEPLVELDLLVDRLEVLEGEFDDVELPAGDPTAPDPTESRKASAPENKKEPTPQTTSTADASAAPREQSTHSSEESDAGEEGSEEDDDEDEGASSSEPAPPRQEPPPPEPAPRDVPTEGGHTEPEPEPEPPSETTEETGATDEAEPDAEDPEVDGRPPADDPSTLGVEERWEKLVEHLRSQRGSTGVKFEHAHPEAFEDGTIELGCEEQFHAFFDDEAHLAEIRDAAAHLFGGDWNVSIEPWDEEVEQAERETLADRREAEWQERKQKLRQDVGNSPAVEKARELFDLTDEDVQVRVELDEK